MQLALTQLEDRSTPVTFQFAYQPDPFLSSEVKGLIEHAGRVIGSRLSPTQLPSTVPVTVATQQMDGALARGGPSSSVLGQGGLITIDPTERWHVGRTTVGLEGGEQDLLSIACHELLHVLGIGTQPDWSAGSRSRGTAISADGFHFAGQVLATGTEAIGGLGRRQLPTDVDLLALNDLGWGATLIVNRPEALSIAGPEGIVRVYLLYEGRLHYIGSTGRYHFLIADVDGDGGLDLTYAPVGVGWAYSFRSDGPVEAALTNGTSLVRQRL